MYKNNVMECDHSEKWLECLCRSTPTELCACEQVNHSPSKCGKKPQQLVKVPQGYQKIKLLEEKGLAKSYLCKDLSDQLCIVKVSKFPKSQEELGRFMQQAEELLQLSHSNLTKLLNVTSNNENHLCVTTEYFKADVLEQVIQNQKPGSFDEVRVADWFSQLSDVTAYLQSKAIFDFEISSSNVYIGQDNKILLPDLGTLQFFSNSVTNSSDSYKNLYKTEEGKEDVYNLGVLFYRICELKGPFNAGEYMSMNKFASTVFEGIIKKMLEKDPSKRPSLRSVKLKLDEVKKNYDSHIEILRFLKHLEKRCDFYKNEVIHNANALVSQIESFCAKELQKFQQTRQNIKQLIIQLTDYSTRDLVMKNNFESAYQRSSDLQSYVEEVVKFPEPDDIIHSIAVFNPPPKQQKYIVSGSDDKTVRVWSLDTGQQTHLLRGHTDSVSTVAISPDNKFIVSGSHDNTISVWNLDTGQRIHLFRGHSDMVRCVVVSRDNKFVVSGSKDNRVKIWNIDSGKQVQLLRGHSSWVWSVAISTENRFVVSGSADSTIRVWSFETGQKKKVLRGHNFAVRSVVISEDNKLVVSGSEDKTIRIWSLETSQQLKLFKGHSYIVMSVAISSDSKFVVSASSDKTLAVWSLETGKKTHLLRGHSFPVLSVTVSRDNKYIVSGAGDKTVVLWNLESGKQVQVLRGHSSSVLAVAV